jgi:hypothetical protein
MSGTIITFISDGVLLGAVLLLLLLVMFYDQFVYLLSAVRTTFMAMLLGKRRLPCGCHGRCNCSRGSYEHLSDAPHSAGNPDLVKNSGPDALDALGYTDSGDIPWTEMIKTTDLDGSVHINHNQFVADVRRFSSGANFTSVADDNTNPAFTNFVGLRRPQHVDILPDARQQPDVDQDVLARNKPLIW